MALGLIVFLYKAFHIHIFLPKLSPPSSSSFFFFFNSLPHHPQASSSSSTLSIFFFSTIYYHALNIQRQKTTMASAGVLRACSFCFTLTVTSLPNSNLKVFIFSLSFPTNIEFLIIYNNELQRICILQSKSYLYLIWLSLMFLKTVLCS